MGVLMRFDGKVAVVTGAGRGIGEAYATALAREGAQVVVAELDVDGGERVAKEIEQSGGTAVFVRTDVSSEDSTLAMAQAGIEAFGGLDYLVNNAAIYGGMELYGLTTMPMDYWDKFMSVNMTGAVLCTRAVYTSMAERGGGAVVNQSSTAAWMGVGYYGIAKLALHGITQSFARELGPMGIRVNALAPGPTDTEATRSTVPAEILDQLLATMPLARMGTPADMADACLFLLSDDARWITGHVLNVDGGQIMRV
jgi:NAD(P)-dependent dehydrogenase (short-subunit alcohol dehydrogenase family)